MSEIAPKSGDYQNGQAWFYRKGSVVTLGLTSLGVEKIGEVESIDLPSDGDDFEKGEVVLTVEGTKGAIELIAPASGTVQELNETAQGEPDIVTEDPLEEGWLIKLEIQDPTDLAEFISE